MAPACAAEGDPDETAFEADDADDEVEEAEARDGCIYFTTPPASDITTYGPLPDEVSRTGTSSGGCDLFAWRTYAQPPANRARTVTFWSASSADTSTAYVWGRNCAGQWCTTWTRHSGTINYNFCDDFMGEYFCMYEAVVELPADNSYNQLVAGGRVIDGGTPREIEITIEQ